MAGTSWRLGAAALAGLALLDAGALAAQGGERYALRRCGTELAGGVAPPGGLNGPPRAPQLAENAE
jgi:hypothetical protein